MNAWMWLVVWLALYLVGWYRTSLYLARRFNESHEQNHPRLSLERYRREHVGEAMVLALAWPIVLPLFALHAAMVPRIGPTRGEIERENERLRDEIARLERETGVGR